jgi:hypothetical protein
MDLELILKSAAPAVATVGLLIGVYQYAKAQRWKKAEFAAKELEKLTNDQPLILACLFLDWESRTMEIPSEYKAMTNEGNFKHSWKVLETAMSPGLTPNDGNRWIPLAGGNVQGCLRQILYVFGDDRPLHQHQPCPCTGHNILKILAEPNMQSRAL